MDDWERLLTATWQKSDTNSKKADDLVTDHISMPNISKRSLDPRPDLTNDTIPWQQMLAAAQDRDQSGELYAALLYMRTRGTVLRRVQNKDGKFVYVLRPWIDRTGNVGWASAEEYETEKHKVLDPVRDRLIELLKVM
jgi:hypothetical protein